jgi:hypothetical protein
MQISAASRRDEPREVVPPPEPYDRRKMPRDLVTELVPENVRTDFIPIDAEARPDLLVEEIGDPAGTDDATGGEAPSTTWGVGKGPGRRGKPGASGFGDRPGSVAGQPPGIRPAIAPPQETEAAVLEGLRWLARHQNEDGSWGASSLAKQCNPKRLCIRTDVEVTSHYDEGLTGLALLAFLGQGLDHMSKAKIVDPVFGKMHDAGSVVREGLRWLRERQKENGSFTPARAFMYNEALATMALAEAYGLSRAQALRRPAQDAVDFLVAAQKIDESGSLSGWRYGSRAELESEREERAVDDGSYFQELMDSDISVTCWVVMALKSARAAGLRVPDDCLQGALAYAGYVSGEDGLVGYQKPEQAGREIPGVGDRFAYHNGTMTALSMCVRTFIQHDIDDRFLGLGAAHIVKDLPEVSEDGLSVDYYYWYHGTLALNQYDGPDSPRADSGRYWKPWNKALQEAVLELQDRSKERQVCARGGWLEDDRWSHAGHALYNTALNVLTLEVYYRFENAFGVRR